jgi:hypothetical protein
LRHTSGVALLGLGLGLAWSFSYVAATAELVDLARPAERGRLVGLNDLLSGCAAPVAEKAQGRLEAALLRNRLAEA